VADRTSGGTNFRFVLGAILLLLIASAIARSVALDRFPVDVHGDEGEVWSDAIRVRDDPSAPFFGLGWFRQPNPCFWLQGIGMDLFGRDMVGLRAGSAIAGTLALAGMAFAAWHTVGPRAAVLSLVPLTAYHWHLQISRTGTTIVQGALLPVWAFGLFALYLRRRGPVPAFACGALIGFSCMVHPAARIAPIVIGVLLLIEVVSQPSRLRSRLPSYAALAAGTLLALAPFLPTMLGEWDAYNERMSGVVIWNEANWARISEGGERSPLEVLAAQTKSAFSMFLGGGDTGRHYGFQGRYVDPFLHGFAIIGFFLSLRRISYPGYRLIAVWFLATVFLGGVLTIDPPYTNRIAPAVGLPYLFAAIGLLAARESATAAFGRAGRRAWLIAAVMLTASAVAWNLHAYFVVYPQTFPPSIVTRLATRLETVPPEAEIRMVTAPNLYWTHGTLRMLQSDRRGRDVTDLEAELATPSDYPRVFIAPREDQLTAERLRARFPTLEQLPSGEASELAFYAAPAGP
jgi:4-amino-4-deoxy-L-arabinose transferase-like glycosyltransferase